MITTCPDPNLCEMLGRHIHGRRYEIWMGRFTSHPRSQKECEEYRRMWCSSARVPLVAAYRRCPWYAADEHFLATWGLSPLPEPDLPPLAVQVMNLTKSAARHIAAGMPEASPEEQNRRESLCRGCEKYRPSDDRCAACGCYVKEKTSWQLEMCPLGKW